MINLVLAIVLTVAPPAISAGSLGEPTAQVMALPPDLLALMQQDVLEGSPSQRTRFDRLLHLLIDDNGLGLTYKDDVTTSVSQTYATRTANCLSFTLLFLAMAREAGLDAYPQEIHQTLAWHQDDGILYRVDHINAVVRIAGRRYLVDVAGDKIIALQQPVQVSDKRLLAHYYNNLAMQELELDQIAPAMQNMTIALQLDPDFSTNWSNAGVLYLRNGDQAAAERAYDKALTLDPQDTSALANMANLEQIQGNHARELEFRKRLESQQLSDPFYYFLQAQGYEHDGNYVQAIEQYKHAIRLHDGEPRFYAALSQAYLLSGDKQQAMRALNRAAWLSTGSTHDDYKAQLAQMGKKN
jgi:Flp pilus assembly protein TadD